jgi:hypothetical protein
MKFHEHYISAMDEGGGHLEEIAFRLATGYDEILTYKGRVSYKIDPVLSSLDMPLFCSPTALQRLFQQAALNDQRFNLRVGR